ncbi:hypothetical protein [uncultured Porphyromonas sp.]|uniref:hypothetical protein n=1 Tax=uncultured Porphyromonas sp. TaxID=159274 RepID=UPI002592E833|nr:hypothetical protein [uncultured Porphyromonas sp.]
MKKVLLLGGTGAMGKHLAQILDEQGDDIYISLKYLLRYICSVWYDTTTASDGRSQDLSSNLLLWQVSS